MSGWLALSGACSTWILGSADGALCALQLPLKIPSVFTASLEIPLSEHTWTQTVILTACCKLLLPLTMRGHMLGVGELVLITNPHPTHG